MKIVAMFLICLSFCAHSESLCSSWETKIEPDMQMPESVFSLDNAKFSKQALMKLEANKSTDLMTDFAIENHSRIVKGYELRALALKSKQAEDVNNFCRFWVNEAFYHD